MKGPHQEQSTELLKGQVTSSDKSVNVPPPFSGNGSDACYCNVNLVVVGVGVNKASTVSCSVSYALPQATAA